MGYRSEVCFCLTKNGKNMLIESLDKANSETKTLVTELLYAADEHIEDLQTGGEIWYWRDLKWYSDYADVGFIEKLVSEMPQEDYRFLRVGDDLEDNEDQGNFWATPHDIYIARSIKFEPALEN